MPQQAAGDPEHDSLQQPAASNDRFSLPGTPAMRGVPAYTPRETPRDVPRYAHNQESPQKFDLDAVMKQETGESERAETATPSAEVEPSMPRTLQPVPHASEHVGVLQPITAEPSEGTAAAGGPKPAQVLVQKLIEIKALPQTESQPAPPRTGQGADARRHSHGASSFSAAQVMEVPMAYEGQTSTSTVMNTGSPSQAQFAGEAPSQSRRQS